MRARPGPAAGGKAGACHDWPRHGHSDSRGIILLRLQLNHHDHDHHNANYNRDIHCHWHRNSTHSTMFFFTTKLKM